MTIVFLTPAYLPAIGGVENHVAALAKLLVAANHRVEIITMSTQATWPTHSVIDGVQVHRFMAESVASWWSRLRYKFAIWRSLAQYQSVLLAADVIHVHDVFWWLWPQWWHYRRRLFITFHGWEGDYPVRINAKIQRWLASKLCRGSIHVGGWISEFYWDHPTAVTYGGVDTDLLTNLTFTPPTAPLQNPVLPSQTTPLKIVFLGRLEATNDIEFYLQLVRELRSVGLSLTITWVGDGSWAEACRAEGAVTGMMGKPEAVIVAADLVFANSYLSMLTAQALGKVVCAFCSHQLKKRYLETYPGYQFMITASELRLMKESILSLLNNRDSWEKIASAAQTFAKEMTWPKVLETYTSVWLRGEKTQTR